MSYCRECGCVLSDASSSICETLSPKPMWRFLRWAPTAIALWMFGLIFAFLSIANIWLAILAFQGSIHDPSIGDSKRMAQVLLRGALENGVIALLCISSWCLMRRQTRNHLLVGAGAVMFALFITSMRWMYWEIRGTNTLSWIEPVLVWPCLIYAIVYAYHESKSFAIAVPPDQSPPLRDS